MRHSLALAAILLAQAAGAQVQRRPAPKPLDGLEEYIEQMRRDWKVPGLAVAIVKDDSIVLMRGFGVRELGGADSVDAHTLFAIGSCSKAFTATLIGMLADEGKLRWNDPAAKYLPGFQLYDPYASRELTIRDLLSHRTGLSRGDLTWYASANSRDDVLNRVKYLKPTWSFRSTFGYQNVMFSAAGEIVGRVSASSWERAVRERIFLPLGMLESSTSITALDGQRDVATPYAEIRDTVRAVPWMNIDNIAPAGSINSSVFDMAQWVRFQLNQGKQGGSQLISVNNLEETHSAQTVIPRDREAEKVNPYSHLRAYGLGWFLQDYRGKLVASHGGNIDGMSAMVALMPEERLGFVMLSNLDGSGLRTPLMLRIFDTFLKAPPRDWSAEIKHRVDSLNAEGRVEQAKQDSARVLGTSPSLPIGQYAGTYSDDLYGDLAIRVENDHLVAQFGPSFIGDLEHWHYDTFRIIWRNPYFDKNRVTFMLDSDGKVASARADLEGPITFRRATDSTALSGE